MLGCSATLCCVSKFGCSRHTESYFSRIFLI
nr:hypothetical protein SEVIR_5G350166v2 [Setaria viridis]